MDQRSERQGNGNHPITTAKRKKNNLKSEDSLETFGTTSSVLTFTL